MSPPILQMRPSITTPASSNLSFSSLIVSDPTHLFLTSSFSHLSIAKSLKSTTIRMGGGPRTFPGGVSKWQWKRMQAKKAKQLLRARLARERQVYEMRKRAELNAAVSELERPWEIVEKAPKLFSTSADEQLKVLADRFQKPGGFDLWSEKDGPQLFETVEGIPSARFFPKGVVHSIKPYGRISDGCSHEESDSVQSDAHDENSRTIHKSDMCIGYQFWEEESGLDPGMVHRNGSIENSRNANGKLVKNLNPESVSVRRNGHEGNPRNANGKLVKNLNPESVLVRRNGHEENPRNANGKYVKKDSRRRIRIAATDSGRDGVNQSENGSVWRKDGKRGNGRKEQFGSNSQVFDTSLEDDGSYGILKQDSQIGKTRQRTQRK